MGRAHLSRRNALHLFAATGLAGLTGCWRRGGPAAPTAKRTPRPLPAEVNGCTLDAGRFGLFASCTESCGPDSPTDEWDHACLHPDTQVYSCGRPARFGGPNVHDHPPGELDLCRRLAAQAEPILAGLDAVGSEGGAPYAGFYLAANRTDPVPDRITPELIHWLFGGTIYPAARIEVEPLQERGKWWEGVLFNYGYNPDGTHRHPAAQKEEDRRIDQWRALVRWFHGQTELRGASYVAIGEDPLSDTNFGCNFPRLHVGLTAAGSLAGVSTVVVHT